MNKKERRERNNLTRKILGERRSNQAAVVIVSTIDDVVTGKLSRNPGMAALKNGEGFVYVRG